LYPTTSRAAPLLRSPTESACADRPSSPARRA
jgi:hypothetical protein